MKITIKTAEYRWYVNIFYRASAYSIYAQIDSDPATEPIIMLEGSNATHYHGRIYYKGQWYIYTTLDISECGETQTFNCEPTDFIFLDKVLEIFVKTIQGYDLPENYWFTDETGQQRAIEILSILDHVH